MKTRSASEWREFWRTRGERELGGLLDEYEPCATRVATLLGSRASHGALAAELAGDGVARAFWPLNSDKVRSTATHKFAYMPRIDSASRAREANRSHSSSYGEDERQSDRHAESIRT